MKKVLDLSLILAALLAVVWMIFDMSKIQDSNTRLIKLHNQIQFDKCLAKDDLSIECNFNN